MRISIENLDKAIAQEEIVIFRIFEVTPDIEQAIYILKGSGFTKLMKDIESREMHKIRYSDILYGEYVERNMFLYTEHKTYMVRESLSVFLTGCPPDFVQVSKNTFVNLYHIQTFGLQKSGNLVVSLHGEERVVVNRRYVKTVKQALEKLSG